MQVGKMGKQIRKYVQVGKISESGTIFFNYVQ